MRELANNRCPSCGEPKLTAIRTQQGIRLFCNNCGGHAFWREGKGFLPIRQKTEQQAKRLDESIEKLKEEG